MDVQNNYSNRVPGQVIGILSVERGKYLTPDNIIDEVRDRLKIFGIGPSTDLSDMVSLILNDGVKRGIITERLDNSTGITSYTIMPQNVDKADDLFNSGKYLPQTTGAK